MAHCSVGLNVNKEYLNTNFDGYKLSLNSIPVYKKRLEFGCEFRALSEHHYAFQHVKAYGFLNLLTGDPWQQDTVYYVDNRWKVMKFSADSEQLGEPISVLQLPNASERGNFKERINSSLVFASRYLAMLSTGTGNLLLVETFNRAENLMWKIAKKIVLDDKPELPFVVLHALEYVDDGVRKAACVLMHVDEKEVKSSQSSFKTVLDWLTLAYDAETSDWCVEAKLSMETDAVPNYVALESDNKAVRIQSERTVKLVQEPGKETIDACESPANGDADKDEEEGTKYIWQQNAEEINVQYKLAEITVKADISFELTHNYIDIKWKGHNDLLKGDLGGDVDVSVSTWTLADNILDICLTKKKPDDWQQVVIGDVRGKFVLDNEQSAAIQQLLNGDGKPAYNVEQLEECDTFPGEFSSMIRFDAGKRAMTHKVNLDSNQWLMNCRADADKMPYIGIRHDVDCIMWQPTDALDSSPWEHMATFNAFGFVLASKTSRKFTCCSPDFSYAVVCDSNRHVYVYRQPAAITTDLRNRKTGRQVAEVASQHCISLDVDDQIAGVHVNNEKIILMVADVMHVFRIN